jgi:PPM family protein phosphatase
MNGELTFELGADSHVGLRYPANFDIWRIQARLGNPALPYVLVADGMGASEGSTTAGQTTMEVLCAGLDAATTITPNLLRRLVAEAQQRVIAAGRRLGELTGCTLSGLIVDGDQGWIVQLGDSRVLRLRDGLLEVLRLAATLTADALAAGGDDNATALILRVR